MMGLSAEKRAYYEEHVQAWRDSGLSQIKYCEHANILYATFKSWPSKLKRSSEIKPKFVEVKAAVRATHDTVLQISLPNGVRIGISSSDESSLVEKVLKFVGQLS